jgi:hypothetical protein
LHLQSFIRVELHTTSSSPVVMLAPGRFLGNAGLRHRLISHKLTGFEGGVVAAM